MKEIHSGPIIAANIENILLHYSFSVDKLTPESTFICSHHASPAPGPLDLKFKLLRYIQGIALMPAATESVWLPVQSLGEMQFGSLIRHKDDTYHNYVVHGNFGVHVTAVKTIDVANAQEWVYSTPFGWSVIKDLMKIEPGQKIRHKVTEGENKNPEFIVTNRHATGLTATQTIDIRDNACDWETYTTFYVNNPRPTPPKAITVCAIFKGERSLGYIKNSLYTFSVAVHNDSGALTIKRMDGTGMCIYDNAVKFLQNWELIRSK